MKTSSKPLVCLLYVLMISCTSKGTKSSIQSYTNSDSTPNSLCGDGFGPSSDEILGYMIKIHRRDPTKIDEIKKYIYDSLVLLRTKARILDLKAILQDYYSMPKPEVTDNSLVYNIHASEMRTEYKIYFRTEDSEKFRKIMDKIAVDRELLAFITSIIIANPRQQSMRQESFYQRDFVVIGLNLSRDVNRAPDIIKKIQKFTENLVISDPPVIGLAIAPGLSMLPTLRFDAKNNPFNAITQRIYKLINESSCVPSEEHLIRNIKEVIAKDYLYVGICKR
jgi:hypothetical protein